MRHITLARVIVALLTMCVLLLVDMTLFVRYDYYVSITSDARFVVALLICACAVMLYERRPH